MQITKARIVRFVGVSAWAHIYVKKVLQNAWREFRHLYNAHLFDAEALLEAVKSSLKIYKKQSISVGDCVEADEFSQGWTSRLKT